MHKYSNVITTTGLCFCVAGWDFTPKPGDYIYAAHPPTPGFSRLAQSGKEHEVLSIANSKFEWAPAYSYKNSCKLFYDDADLISKFIDIARDTAPIIFDPRPEAMLEFSGCLLRRPDPQS